MPHECDSMPRGVREGGRVIIVYEYCRGGNLEEEIRSYGGSGLPLRRFKAIARQLVAGLCEIHKRGLAHCDVKPENVLLWDAAGSEAKLSDFGMGCGGGRTRAIVGPRCSGRGRFGVVTVTTRSWRMNGPSVSASCICCRGPCRTRGRLRENSGNR
jgi:serine/threonine protein kinase